MKWGVIGLAWMLSLVLGTVTAEKTKMIFVPPVEMLREMTDEEINEHIRKMPSERPLSTSTYHMSRIATDEALAAIKLKGLMDAMETARDVIDRYLSSWKELVSAGVEREGFVSHPLHAYAFTKHVSLGWPHVEAAVGALTNLTDDMTWLMSRRSEQGVPTSADLGTVSAGLARLHDYYGLNLTALSHAHLVSRPHARPVPAGIAPSVLDLHRISLEAMSHNVLNSGVDFLKVALDRWDANVSFTSNIDAFDTPRDFQHLASSLRKAEQFHDQVLEQKGPRSNFHSTHEKPFNKTLARKKKYHKKLEVVLGRLGNSNQGLTQYRRLCRGEDLRPVEVTSKLYCRYVTNGSPLYVIGPLRMEVVSLDPFVVTMEDVVSPSEASDLMNISAGYLTRSSTLRANGGAAESFMRTSSTAWMLDSDLPVLSQLTNRIEQLTGMNAEQNKGAEMYQVVNYGVGGHYTVHHDFVERGLVNNRIATFLIYLKDVPQGGRTVFPWVGTGVAPRRGSALLWYNMKQSGMADLRLHHGACPVLFGDKWVINKWIYYGGQMNTLRCTPGKRDDTVRQPLT